MAWLKRKTEAPEITKKATSLSGGSKVLDVEQQQQSRERMEKELDEQRAKRA